MGLSDDFKPLSEEEQKNIGWEIYKLVKQSGLVPYGAVVRYQYMEAKKQCISVYTLPNSQYREMNVLGDFKADVYFRVAYKSTTTDDLGRAEAQTVVDSIMNYLRNYNDLPPIGENRTITSISASNSIGYKDDADDSGMTVFAADGIMKYETN